MMQMMNAELMDVMGYVALGMLFIGDVAGVYVVYKIFKTFNKIKHEND